MKKLLLLTVVPVLMFGDDLKSLLEFAKENNNLVNASKITVEAKDKEVQSAKSNYYPTLDASAFYKRDDDASPFQPGTVYGANAKLGFDIYDGGKKSYTEKQKINEKRAAGFTYEDTKKSTELSITQDFYNLQSLNASLQARVEASNAVKAQLDRVRHFYEADLATSDDVDRLQSAYDSNIYAIESIKFQITALKKALELKVGKRISSLDESEFVKTVQDNQEELDSIQALRFNKRALENLSETVTSYYMPTIRIEDTYSVYGYQDKPVIQIPVAGVPPAPIELLDNQNEIMATVGIRLFDFGTLREQKEAIQLQADALNQQIIFKSKEQKMQLELATQRIHTAKLNIKSSKSALKAATSALKTITEKYNAGIVDNVVYLDALSSKTEAKARYETALNNLEIAYALYYYYNNKNLEEYLK
ncbi:TolC family protein [Sulfurimonas paralvinellae]|uniref:TolC family protein n=1 Tax=Sulfurimonas paralvinellae TaxID=317658 RepID=A0A7M1B905_9BACT|nr:TolC family protein [Sulfurimonas paralvinellae]QOP45232.1 TolC family protein [Sulfurimonas paralvinellae]